LKILLNRSNGPYQYFEDLISCHRVSNESWHVCLLLISGPTFYYVNFEPSFQLISFLELGVVEPKEATKQ